MLSHLGKKSDDHVVSALSSSRYYRCLTSSWKKLTSVPSSPRQQSLLLQSHAYVYFFVRITARNVCRHVSVVCYR